MATRTITGTILRANGSPWKGGEVRFALVDDTFTVSPDQTLPTNTIVAVADDAGAISVTLVSGLDKEYEVTLPDRETFRIVVPAGAATTLEVLRAAYVGIPSPSGAPLMGPTGPSFMAIYEGASIVDANPTKLIFDATDFNLTESPEDEIAVALAYGTSAGTPAEGNHAHALDDLSDVVISSPANGQGLVYLSGWKNATMIQHEVFSGAPATASTASTVTYSTYLTFTAVFPAGDWESTMIVIGSFINNTVGDGAQLHISSPVASSYDPTDGSSQANARFSLSTSAKGTWTSNGSTPVTFTAQYRALTGGTATAIAGTILVIARRVA